jgi:hypothetical protein
MKVNTLFVQYLEKCYANSTELNGKDKTTQKCGVQPINYRLEKNKEIYSSK